MITFTVKPDYGDAYEVKATARDVYVWEKTNQGKVFSGLMERLSMVDLYCLAYTAARRQGLFTGTLQELVESSDLDFDTQEAAGEAIPFGPEASDTPASPSPSPPASHRASGPKKAVRL